MIETTTPVRRKPMKEGEVDLFNPADVVEVYNPLTNDLVKSKLMSCYKITDGRYVFVRGITSELIDALFIPEDILFARREKISLVFPGYEKRFIRRGRDEEFTDMNRVVERSRIAGLLEK